MEFEGLDVTVAIPSGHDVKAYFAHDLAQMMIHTALHYLKPGNLSSLNLAWQVGTYIHEARQVLASTAISVGTDYTLFIDSDMRFPQDALLKLLLHGKAMVGTNYSSRTFPAKFVGIKRVTNQETSEAGEKLRTGLDSTGLESVDALGFGFMLIRHDVFAALPDPQESPWFWFDFIKGSPSNIGEDVHFCNLVREYGFEIFVDHDLSKQIVHIGDAYFDYRHPLAAEEDEA